MGDRNVSSAIRSVTLGSQNQVTGEYYGIAIGGLNTVSDSYSAAIGSNNTVANAYTYVLGNDITSTQDNSVILGNASTDRAATTVSEATVGSLTYGDFAGQGSADNGVVSIGAEGAERQLINVAAGEVSATSTDAINGSQLYAVAEALNNVAESTVAVLGGNAALSPDGTISMTNIGGTGKDTIDDAIKAAITEVEEGKNITVTSETGANGQTVYTVATADDVTFTSVTSDKVTVGDVVIDSTTNKITGVAAGDISSTSTDAVNGSQLYTTNQNVATNTANIATNTANIATNTANIATNTANIATNTANIATNADNIATNTANIAKGLNFADENGNTYNAQLGDTITVKGDSKSITTTLDGNGNYTVALADDISVNSVTTGDVSMSADGINAGNKTITNVAAGVNDTDAVNVSQLKGITQDIDNVKRYAADNRKRAKAGTAAGIAHASIPQVIGAGRSSLGIGTGGYGGQSAVAVGYSRASDNGKHIIKLSVGQDKYQTSYGAGYSYQW